jgi:hypothetical protein
MTIDWYALLIHVIVNTIIISPALWLAGRAIAGKQKAKFTDAIWIVVLGTVLGTLLAWAIGTFFSAFSSGWIVTIILLIVWLALVKHFFDCGWLKALAISIVAVIFFVIIVFILALIGIAIAIILF